MTTLINRFAGPVHRPGDAGYDAQRQPLHPTIDPRPAIVAEATSAADVRGAIEYARQHDLPFAVQATGHGTRVPADGGLLLKTSGLATVLVDPDRRIARVGPGARWADVLAAAGPFGLAPLSGSSPSVGVTGYTLGGGVGWLSRRYGFAADSVVRAEVVTADGRIVTARADRNADLFWALRGGGGNFGVVTRLEFRLYPVARVYAGTVTFPASRAADLLAWYREWAPSLPYELSTAVVLRPDGVTVKAMYAGDTDTARRLLCPLWSFGPVRDEMREVPYAEATMGGTAARYLDYFHTPPVEALVGLPSTVEIRHWGGAMAQPGPDAGPAGHRTAPFSVIVDGPAPAGLSSYGIGGTFLNFLADPARTATAFTAQNYERLRYVKAAYDPDNVFRLNHNIPPAGSVAGAAAS